MAPSQRMLLSRNSKLGAIPCPIGEFMEKQSKLEKRSASASPRSASRSRGRSSQGDGCSVASRRRSSRACRSRSRGSRGSSDRERSCSSSRSPTLIASRSCSLHSLKGQTDGVAVVETGGSTIVEKLVLPALQSTAVPETIEFAFDSLSTAPRTDKQPSSSLSTKQNHVSLGVVASPSEVSVNSSISEFAALNVTTTSFRKRKQEEVLAPVEPRLFKRAAALRYKYRQPQPWPEDGSGKVQLHPSLLGFHFWNRDNIPPNGERCDELTCEYDTNGYDPEEAERDNIAVRWRAGDTKQVEYNRRSCAADRLLANVPSEWALVALTLSHSHTNQVHKNALAGTKSSAKGFCSSTGYLDMSVIRGRDVEFFNKAQAGLHWELLSADMELEEPEAAAIISCAQNTKNGVALLAHELQGLCRMAKYCKIETDIANSINYRSVVAHVKSTMPDVAGLIPYCEFLPVGLF
jgi:hypothetical protein